MENWLAAFKGTNITEDLACNIECFVNMLSYSCAVMRVASYGYYLAAKLTKALDVIEGWKGLRNTVDTACIDFHSNPFLGDSSHDLIGNLAVISIFQRRMRGIML